MKLLQAFFRLNAIYQRQTIRDILNTNAIVFGGYILAAVLSIHLLSYESLVIYAWIVGILLLYLLMRSILKSMLVNAWFEERTLVPSSPGEAGLGLLAANLELDTIDEVQLLADSNGIKAYVITGNFYAQTKYGTYRSKQIYYTIAVAMLARELPQLVFDSRQAKGRQFKSRYLGAQRISVQGGFDDVFDTYAPTTYAIDSLSFITPEVMDAMFDARQYDIEINGKQLVLYGPLIGSEPVETMMAKLSRIAADLNDNIDTYRDDRLTGLLRKQSVTPFSRTLLRNPTVYIVWAVILGTISVAILTAALIIGGENGGNIAVNQLSITAYSFFIVNAFQGFKIKRENSKRLKAFYVLHYTDRGKPRRAASRV